MLELDWFARTYGWTPDESVRQPRQVISDLRALREVRRAAGGQGG